MNHGRKKVAFALSRLRRDFGEEAYLRAARRALRSVAETLLEEAEARAGRRSLDDGLGLEEWATEPETKH